MKMGLAAADPLYTVYTHTNAHIVGGQGANVMGAAPQSWLHLLQRARARECELSISLFTCMVWVWVRVRPVCVCVQLLLLLTSLPLPLPCRIAASNHLCIDIEINFLFGYFYHQTLPKDRPSFNCYRSMYVLPFHLWSISSPDALARNLILNYLVVYLVLSLSISQ